MKKKEEDQINNTDIYTNKNKKCQLFLLHFAGGSCYSFEFLKEYFGSNVEFIPIELPGRGKRYGKQLLRVKADAVEDLYNQIIALRNRSLPYLIYGHSMGATLGLNVVKRMEDIHDLPQYLVVSGNPGPGIKEVIEKEEKKGKRYLMDDAEFKKELQELGGIPEEVLANEELYAFFNPILRADFELLEKNVFEEKNIKLQTPIYALMGSKEEDNSKIDNWQNFTYGEFHSQILSGDHFFINNHPDKIANLILTLYDLNLKFPTCSKQPF